MRGIIALAAVNPCQCAEMVIVEFIASVRLTVQEEFQVTFREIFPNSLLPHTSVSVR